MGAPAGRPADPLGEVPAETSPAAHPALEGREQESAALADAVRRLTKLCATTAAPPEATMAAVMGLDAIADALEQHPSDSPGTKVLLTETAEGGEIDLAARMPFDVVIGRHNPLALPLSVSFEPPKALLRGTFTRPYEGPPDCVHGAVLAASFDIVLAAANVIAGLPGPTARLNITYRRPTALYEPCLFEGCVESRQGDRVRTVGRLIQHDRVTVEAAGEFVLLDHAEIIRMAERARAAKHSGPSP